MEDCNSLEKGSLSYCLFRLSFCTEGMEAVLKAGCLQSASAVLEQTALMKDTFFGKCSDLDLAALFILTLEGARDLALPLSEHVKVETHVMQMWELSCDDS